MYFFFYFYTRWYVPVPVLHGLRRAKRAGGQEGRHQVKKEGRQGLGQGGLAKGLMNDEQGIWNG